MSAFGALMQRELRLAARSGGDLLTLVLFFVLVGIILPFAVGPDRPLLMTLAPAIIWLAALLALLLSVDRLFRADHESGVLAALRHGPLPLPTIILVKIVAQWLTGALPLILATPLLALLLGMDGTGLGLLLAALLAGTPALSANAALGAALAQALPRGGLIAPVIILPFAVPVLIFGTAASDPAGSATVSGFLFLGGFSLLAMVIAPFAAALALHHGGD